MTIANFKNMIYGFLNRDTSIFTTTQGGSTDQVLMAMNAVRRAAQRNYAFELLRTDVFLATYQAGANWQTGCTATPGGTSVLMRKIDGVWLYTTSGGLYLRNQRVDLGNVNDYKRELGVYSGALDISQSILPIYQRPFAYTNGTNLVVNGYATSSSFMLNGIQWLDDLTGAEPPDMFLTYFTDWFQWATIGYLNLFLKDSSVVAVDAAMVQNLWQSVKEYDGQFANAGDSASLD